MHLTALSTSRLRASLAIGASFAALALVQNAQAQAVPCADGASGPGCLVTAAAGNALDDASFTFDNTDTITGSVELNLAATTVTVENSGSVTGVGIPLNQTTFPNAMYGGDVVFSVENRTAGNQDVSFVNSGTIASTAKAQSGVVIALDTDDVNDALRDGSAVVSVVNRGTISATGGATIVTRQFATFLEEGQMLVNPMAALAVDASDMPGGSIITISNEVGGLIRAGGALSMVTPNGYSPLPNGQDGALTVAVFASGGTINIANAGTIEGGAGSTFGTNLVSNNIEPRDGYLAGAIHTEGDEYGSTAANATYIASLDTVTNTATGVIIGSIDLGGNDDMLANSGAITGDVYMRDGDDAVRNYGTFTGDLFLGSGNDSFTQAVSAVFTGIADGQDGTDTFILDLTGGGTIDQSIYTRLLNFEVFNLIGQGQVDVALGDDDDDFTNNGFLEGQVNLGGGSNSFANSGTITDDVTAGQGSDDISNEGTIGGSVYLDGAPAPASEPAQGAASLGNMLRAAGEFTPTGGDDTFTNTALVEGSVFAGGGNDRVTNSGTILGDLDLGEGNDALVLQGSWAIGGAATGGRGTDAVTLALRGGAEPQVLDLARFTQFETLGLSGGTGIVTSSMTFGQINVGAGRLIGAAGSTIMGNVAVASGGTFGSAGTVNGNIAVASGGTLSPGASPAVMTVNGNVSLAAGSATLFEFVPAPGQSDQLLIGGTLTIASGAMLNIVGNRPLTPGTAYDLIVADQISGQFTIGTWDRSLVQGFLRYLDGTTADRLQLLGTFVFQAPAAPQPTAAVNHVNGLLVGGTASAALNAAIPQLLDASGFASAAAFLLLTPEPYASATQLGVETGLSLAKASRSGLVQVAADKAQLFGFGIGSGAWRTLAADATLGTSRARNHETGGIGGIGFGTSAASVGGFVGYVDGRQRIAALGAQTDVDGMLAGVAGHIGAGGFTLDALAGYHWGKAETQRAVPAGGTASGAYTLRSLVLDAHAGYAIALGGLAVTPAAGLTHISVRRQTATEIGSAAFGLNVAGARTSATFIDGSLEVAGAADSALRPWASVGVRHQLDGDLVFATASLIGSTATFTVPGVPRRDTVVTTGAGLEADLAENFTMTASYAGEFGGGSGNAVTVGMRARF